MEDKLVNQHYVTFKQCLNRTAFKLKIACALEMDSLLFNWIIVDI